MAIQTVTEGIELILNRKVSQQEIHKRNTQDNVGPTTDLIRTEDAIRWLAARLDAEIRKTEVIIDEAGLR